jgi:two-component system CheB/CheR fusion protein
MFGYSAGEMIGQSIRRVIPTHRQAEEDMILARLARSENIVHFETKRVTKDGQTFDASVTISPVRDAEGRTIGAAKIIRDITAAKNAELALHESEKRLRVVVAELQHRTRNLISVVSATVERILRTSKTFDDFKASFQDRIEALGRVQGLLFRMKENDRVTFNELIETELSAQSVRVGEGGPITLDGPKGVRLRSGTVQTLAMVLHELMTNAVKHGALKQSNAHLAIRWRLEAMGEGGKPWLRLDWKESGVEMPPLPHGIGQGRELIERALPYQFDAQTTFALEADGVRCTISLPVSEHEGRERP